MQSLYKLGSTLMNNEWNNGKLELLVNLYIIC